MYRQFLAVLGQGLWPPSSRDLSQIYFSVCFSFKTDVLNLIQSFEVFEMVKVYAKVSYKKLRAEVYNITERDKRLVAAEVVHIKKWIVLLLSETLK